MDYRIFEFACVPSSAVRSGVDRAYVGCSLFNSVLGCVIAVQTSVPHFLNFSKRVQNVPTFSVVVPGSIDGSSQPVSSPITLPVFTSFCLFTWCALDSLFLLYGCNCVCNRLILLLLPMGGGISVLWSMLTITSDQAAPTPINVLFDGVVVFLICL